MEWKEIAQWMWMGFLALFGVVLKLFHTRLGKLEDKMPHKISEAEHKEFQLKVREDINNLHKKVEANAKEQRQATDAGFREMRERLDALLERRH